MSRFARSSQRGMRSFAKWASTSTLESEPEKQASRCGVSPRRLLFVSADSAGLVRPLPSGRYGGIGGFATLRRAFRCAWTDAGYSYCAHTNVRMAPESARARWTKMHGGQGAHVGTLPAIRKAGGHYPLREEISGAGAKFAAALLSVHQSGDDSLWAVLLEPGLPILPRDVPTPR